MKTLTLSGLMRATNRNLFLPIAVLIAVVFLITGSMRTYLGSLVQGPKTVNWANLKNITDVYDLTPDYVKIRGNKNFDVGTVGFQQGYFGPVTRTGYLRLLKQNNDYLVVKTATANDTRLEYAGILEVLPRDARRSIDDGLYQTNPQAKLYSFLLHADSPPQPWVGLGVAALTLVMLWYVVQWARRSTDLMSHPLVKRLAPYGSFKQIEAHINHDLEQPNPIRLGRTRPMLQWLLQINLFSLNALPFSDVNWIYAKIRQRRWHGIPTSRDYSVMIYCKHQPALEISLTERQSVALLEVLQARAPWAIFGFSDGLETAWEDNRDDFLAKVEQRKQISDRTQTVTA